MADSYSVTIDIEVHDEQELWLHARQHFIDDNAGREVTQEELDEMFGDGADDDEPYNIHACLQQILDPGVSPPGTEIQGSYAEMC
jgi:hypothetical protein